MGYLAFAAVAFATLSVIAALLYVVAVWVRGVQKIVEQNVQRQPTVFG